MAFFPTAGFGLDVGGGAGPGPLPGSDRQRLRDLAWQVAEVAHQPRQATRRALWFRHNRLDPARPMLLVYPEEAWEELLGPASLALSDPYWRQWEWYLLHLLYRDQHLQDDFVVEPLLYVEKVVRLGGWGLDLKYDRPAAAKGAWRYDPPLKSPRDLDRLTFPTLAVDEAETRRRVDAVGEALGDILDVRPHCNTRSLLRANLVTEATRLRGIEQVMLDMYDRPAWLHELMGFLTEGVLRHATLLEAGGHLTPNSGHHYVDAGGLGYTDELPQPGEPGQQLSLADLWGSGLAQEFAHVSPAQHDEFALQYQLRILARFGLNAYGCCEPLTAKFGIVRQIPRLRRVSISAWCDVERAAAELGASYICSWKPAPAMLLGRLDPDAVRLYIRRTLEATRGCVVEVILKDLITLEGNPAKLATWIGIAREEIERVSG